MLKIVRADIHAGRPLRENWIRESIHKAQGDRDRPFHADFRKREKADLLLLSEISSSTPCKGYLGKRPRGVPFHRWDQVFISPGTMTAG